jgi:hypothetical protein
LRLKKTLNKKIYNFLGGISLEFEAVASVADGKTYLVIRSIVSIATT